jgi:hypothetical protein
LDGEVRDMSDHAEAEKALRYILSEVRAEPLTFSGDGLILVEDLICLPPSYMIRIMLERFVGAEFSNRPFEKTAWVSAVSFRGALFVFTMEKFGLRLRVRTPDDEDTSALLQALTTVLNRALPQAERAIEPEIHDLIRTGRITIPNKYHLFRDRYVYMRDLATANFESDPPPPVIRSGWTESQPFKPQREGYFAASAAIDAYFSWLEHLLVLLLPFSSFDSINDDLESLITSTWAEKFKRIFDLASDRAAKAAYERLRAIKEEHRNPATHGGFDRALSLVHVHTAGTGAIPARLSRTPETRLSLHPLTDSSWSEICDELDEADAFLIDGTHELGHKFVEGGLDVYFNAEFVSQCEAALADPETFHEFSMRIGLQQEQAANMDW